MQHTRTRRTRGRSLARLNTTLVVAAAIFVPLALASAVPADRTLAEFKEYVASKMSDLSDAQLDAIAKLVDKDGDGVISEGEFGGRMAAIQTVIASGEATAPEDDGEEMIAEPVPAGSSDYMSGTPVDVPPLTGSPQVDVLLITGDEIAKAWVPFAEWKTRNGKSTRIITVGRIARDYEAAGIQEKIRLCVRDHVENHGTRWVLLGGDSLPGGTGLVPGGHTTVHAQERAGIPTDIVYLSKSNWDADGDGIYGEWEDDQKAISYPDGSVGLGRVPVRSAADVAAYTEKVIAYESRYPTEKFAKKIIYTCTDKPAYPKVRNSWDGYLSVAWAGGEVGRFFSAETPWDEEGNPGSYQLSAEHVVDLINARNTSKLHIHGHGFIKEWILERSSFSAKNVGELTNDGAYPLMTTVSCNTGEYDSKDDPSIVEAMVRQPKGGSVAVFAPVRTGKPHFHSPSDMRLMVSEGKLDGTTGTMTRYWVNGLGEGLTTGQAAMKAVGSLEADARKTAGYHLCICELNLLGDPTLDMRAKDPVKPKLKAPATISTGEQTVAINTDTPGATVCLWKGWEVYAIVPTDANGKAKLQVTPKTKGELLVTVTGPSLNSATASITVQ